jgi:hypothetical protein
MTDINDTLAERGSRYGKFTGHAALVAKAERELVAARLQLQHAQGELGRIKGMKSPTDLHVRKPDRDPREDIADGIRQVIPSFGMIKRSGGSHE